MAITYGGIGTVVANGTAGTTVLVPIPATVLADDYLVLFVAYNSIAASATVPGGWTSLFQINSGGSTPSLAAMGKKAVGGESGTQSVTIPSSTNNGRMVKFAGVDTVTPVDVAASVIQNSTAIQPVVPTMTTTMVGVALVLMGTANASTGTWTPPSGPAAFTEVHDALATPESTIDYLIWSGSGATGTISPVLSTAVRNCVGVVALRPAGAAASLVVPRRDSRGLLLRSRKPRAA